MQLFASLYLKLFTEESRVNCGYSCGYFSHPLDNRNEASPNTFQSVDIVVETKT